MSHHATDRQLDVLRRIAQHLAAFHWPPTVRELGEALGITSTNGVVDHLKALEAKGLVRRAKGTARAIALTSRGQALLRANPPLQECEP